jgi:hypothetical protein
MLMPCGQSGVFVMQDHRYRRAAALDLNTMLPVERA